MSVYLLLSMNIVLRRGSGMSITKLEHEIVAQNSAQDESRRLRVVHGRQGVNLPAVERAVRDLLCALGRDPSSPHLADTPRRVAESLTEMLTPREFDLTTFPNDENYDELVLAKNIPVHSLCEHHMLPFTGVAHVGYLPGAQRDNAGQLGPAEDALARKVADVGDPGERQHVVLAKGLHRDAPREHQLVIVLVVGEGREVELAWREHLGERLRDPAGGIRPVSYTHLRAHETGR